MAWLDSANKPGPAGQVPRTITVTSSIDVSPRPASARANAVRLGRNVHTQEAELGQPGDERRRLGITSRDHGADHYPPAKQPADRIAAGVVDLSRAGCEQGAQQSLAVEPGARCGPGCGCRRTLPVAGASRHASSPPAIAARCHTPRTPSLAYSPWPAAVACSRKLRPSPSAIAASIRRRPMPLPCKDGATCTSPIVACPESTGNSTAVPNSLPASRQATPRPSSRATWPSPPHGAASRSRRRGMRQPVHLPASNGLAWRPKSTGDKNIQELAPMPGHVSASC